ncbi:hypothetical protein F4801DRAFT_581628 [Xylaria longipes]|nr:hypothetical protein F4801DRAFT_581628 [Xylaria longipes]
MSGFEIAGIVLGAIPLVISALENYKTGQSTLAALVKYQGQLDKLLYQLKVQQTEFYFDILELLRSAEIEEVDDRVNISLEDCLSILQNNKNGGQLQEYLGIHHSAFFDILRRYEQCLKKIAKKLKHVRRLPNAQKDDLAALLVANPPIDGHFKFQERISFSIERGALNALIGDLREDRLNLKEIIKGMRTKKDLSICDLVLQSQISDYILSLKLKGEALEFMQETHQIQRELSTPTTLESVLRKGAADREFRMTPKQRSQLVLDIASSIIQLRKTCWSSPVLSSKVIKYILGANGKSARVSTIAFIEQVTELNRATLPGSEPKVALLELAILLLEIWHHETLEMWAEKAGFGDTNTTDERLMAATKWLDATEAEFPRSRHWDDIELLRLYCENVIKPLNVSCGIW